jgi:hypothetical protein
VKSLNEKSMLIVTALTLGLIITWLIATDPSSPALAANSDGLAAAALVNTH